MIDVTFQPPDPFGLDWADPGQVSRYAESQNEAIRQAFEEVRRIGNNPKYIHITGMSPEEMVSTVAPWPGELKFFDGTLAQARSWGQKYGWAVCDGTQGAPDLREKFVMGAVADAGAGGTGGSSVHTHCVPGCLHSHDLDLVTADNCGGHTHGLSGSVSAGAASVSVCGGSVAVAPYNHGHGNTFTIGTCGLHGHGFTDEDTGDTTPNKVTTDAQAAGGGLPPYYEIIILRKKAWTI